MESSRFGSLHSHFLRMSPGKLSFWKPSFSLFAKVSWKTLVLEVYILTFCECLVQSARFLSLHSHFLRMSRGKRSFWKSTMSRARFGSFRCHFLRTSRGKRSFWESTFSLFANVSWKMFVLEAFIVRFCECLVENARFETLPFCASMV